jgi:hypothetical protein
MKKCIAVLMFLALFVIVSVPVFAAGNVTYNGTAGKFIFSPGSRYSPTDMFTEFKNVMPGDHLTQKITVKSNISDETKANIYIRSRGAAEGSEAFLSQLGIRVAVAQDNIMGYMFDAAASETAQLGEWVLLGTLYSGGKVDLEVTLDVPITLGNEFQDAIGYLLWEFKVEEFPKEGTDPTPPLTGDSMPVELLAAVAVASLLGIGAVILLRKKS